MIQVWIYTAVGPVKLMNLVAVLKADVDDDERFVGTDLPIALGFDVDQQLE
ncbi:hypothetical protein PI124_g569 [Phytophthora idaei]|nr:hypothetical protein PI125_g9880 [Phytophthora idaei]KAG3152320.1 hypothetical protein PI126_g10565 [Phytophthora idaei]KAG3254933.1 hypothetical protein PI124_g569 [Phytophthora idaei]